MVPETLMAPKDNLNESPISGGHEAREDEAADWPEVRPADDAEMSAFQAYLLGALGLYLAACVYCVLKAGPGPGHEANWGPVFGMFIFGQLALPGGLIAMLITLPLGRINGLTNQTARRIIVVVALMICLCWVYSLFIWG